MSTLEGLKTRQYDFPLFCGLWLHGNLNKEESSSPTAENRASGPHLILLGGGGGAGAHGVKNKLALVEYNAAICSLSDEVSGHATGSDAAQAAALHPSGSPVLVAFSEPGHLRAYPVHPHREPRLGPPPEPLPALQAAGEQRALAFSPLGNLLATGGQDGALRVFGWPALQPLLHVPAAHADAVRSLAFSADGRFLACTSRSRRCPVWELAPPARQEPLAVLATAQGSIISLVRFSRGGPPRAFLAVVAGGHGWVQVWSVTPPRCLRRRRVQRAPISCLALSPNGALLATASAEGDVLVLGAAQLELKLRVRRAHHLFITGLDFAPDSRALLSISGDSSACVTSLHQLEDATSIRDLLLALLVAVLAALLALYLQERVGFASIKSITKSGE